MQALKKRKLHELEDNEGMTGGNPESFLFVYGRERRGGTGRNPT